VAIERIDHVGSNLKLVAFANWKRLEDREGLVQRATRPDGEELGYVAQLKAGGFTIESGLM